MKTSYKGVAFIAAHEGVVTRAYRDVAGVWTIGVGHTAAAGPPKPAAGTTITRTEAYRILADDLARVFEPRVRKALGDVPQHVFDGAVSFDFNTGAIDRASWVRHYRAGNLGEAEASLKLWTRAGGRTVTGLVRRRNEEADLIFRGGYGTAGAVPPETAPSVSMSSDDIADYQRQLAALGFDPGPVDGIAGEKTRAAVLAYQRARGLVADGIVGPATRASLTRDVDILEGGATAAAARPPTASAPVPPPPAPTAPAAPPASPAAPAATWPAALAAAIRGLIASLAALLGIGR